jgi:hypothetical protein
VFQRNPKCRRHVHSVRGYAKIHAVGQVNVFDFQVVGVCEIFDAAVVFHLLGLNLNQLVVPAPVLFIQTRNRNQLLELLDVQENFISALGDIFQQIQVSEQQIGGEGQ